MPPCLLATHERSLLCCAISGNLPPLVRKYFRNAERGMKMAQFCSGCGAQMADGATVCAACGKSQVAAAAAAAAPAASGLNDNIAGLLAYFFIPAIVFLVLEPFNRNPFVRFHAFQGLFLGLASIVGHTILSFIPVLGWILLPFFSLAIFVLGVIAAVKAFQSQKWRIPVIGDLAEKQAAAM
jgi:uncharacterized membrane protein